MKISKKNIERRKNKRLQVKDGTYAVIGSNPTIIGQVVNISNGGLAVRYTKNDKRLRKSEKIDIFRSDAGFYCYKIPVKTITDYKISSKFSLGFKKIWQRSLQFGKLNKYHETLLDHFFQNYSANHI